MARRTAVNKAVVLAMLAVLANALTTPNASAQEPTPEDSPRRWDFYAGLYGWLAGVDGTVAVGPLTEIPVQVPFGEIIDNVDIGFSLHFEAQQARGFTLLADLFYVDLSFSAEEPVSETPLTLNQKQIFVEGAAGYHIARNREILGAVRYIDLSINASTSEGETDDRSAG